MTLKHNAMLQIRTPCKRKKYLTLLLFTLLIGIGGCTHLAVEDCGGEVLGDNKPRIRSSHFRMFLANLPAASERFVEYAAMSSLAYAEDQDCGTALPERKISPEDREDLEGILSTRGWKEISNPLWIPPCEDDVGLYFRVWERNSKGTKEVTISFRGTWGFRDWVYGNMHWLTRFLPIPASTFFASSAMRFGLRGGVLSARSPMCGTGQRPAHHTS